MAVHLKKCDHRGETHSLVAIDEGMVLDQTPRNGSCNVRHGRIGVVVGRIFSPSHGGLEQSTVAQAVGAAVEVDHLCLERFNKLNRWEDHRYFASSR